MRAFTQVEKKWGGVESKVPILPSTKNSGQHFSGCFWRKEKRTSRFYMETFRSSFQPLLVSNQHQLIPCFLLAPVIYVKHSQLKRAALILVKYQFKPKKATHSQVWETAAIHRHKGAESKIDGNPNSGIRKTLPSIWSCGLSALLTTFFFIQLLYKLYCHKCRKWYMHSI